MTQYEKMGGTYRRAGDYIIPNLSVGAEQNSEIGIFGQRHKRFLKEHHRVRYYNLITAGKLNSYLADIDNQAENLFNELVKSLAEKENVTEKLKATEPMKWAQMMNNIRNRATEIVNAEVIFV